jgi:phosphoglycerate dehydrogenase-like enzyme
MKNARRPCRKIALLDQISPARLEQVRGLLPEGFMIAGVEQPGEAHRFTLIADAEFAIAGQVAVDGDLLRAAPKLKLLHKWGVGIDNIDVNTAQKLGITVARTTGSNAVPVAEFTLGLMLSALRCIPYGHHHLMQGQWHGPSGLPAPTMLLSGKTVGLIGFGAIGQKVALLLKGFGCPILYTTRQPVTVDIEQSLGAKFVPLCELLAQSDIVSLHCPLTPETAGMIDRAALTRMKRSAVLINTARGGIVVENELVDALRTGVINSAATDVFAQEPLPPDSKLRTLDNLVMTPHLAAVTADTFAPTIRRMFENFRKMAQGEPLPPGDLVTQIIPSPDKNHLRIQG